MAVITNEEGQPEKHGAVEVLAPAERASPVIFASPHSGRDYPDDLLRKSRLDRHALRQSEDSYVDLLFDAAPQYGAPLLRALFPRAYVDVNRARDELDPRMFADRVPHRVDARSSRVIAGLGCCSSHRRRRQRYLCAEALSCRCRAAPGELLRSLSPELSNRSFKSPASSLGVRC